MCRDFHIPLFAPLSCCKLYSPPYKVVISGKLVHVMYFECSFPWMNESAAVSLPILLYFIFSYATPLLQLVHVQLSENMCGIFFVWFLGVLLGGWIPWLHFCHANIFQQRPNVFWNCDIKFWYPIPLKIKDIDFLKFYSVIDWGYLGKKKIDNLTMTSKL